MKHPELWPKLFIATEYNFAAQTRHLALVRALVRQGGALCQGGALYITLATLVLTEKCISDVNKQPRDILREAYNMATKKKDTVPTLTDWWGELAGIGENNEGAEGPLFDEATRSLAAELARRAGKDPEDLDMLNLPIGDGGAPVKVQIPIWMAFVDQARQISDKIAGRG